MAEKLDLKTLNRDQLVERLNRQEKLLANKKFLKSLPDKGKKITDMVIKLQQLIARKEELNATMATFQQMRISQQPMHVMRDSDDDDEEEEEDLEQDDHFEASASKLHHDKVSTKLIKVSKMVEMSRKDSETAKEMSAQGKKVKSSKVWDYESAVTGPPQRFGRAQMLPLEESLKLQQVQQRKYEEIQAQHATQRLREQTQGQTSHLTLPTTNTSEYRDKNHADYDKGESEDEEEAERTYSDDD